MKIEVTPKGDSVVPLRPEASTGDIEAELDAIVAMVSALDSEMPDVVIQMCGPLMSRCTEIYLQLVRSEARDRKAKALRTMQLQPVMELIDFTFRCASRLIEVRRQDLDLTRG